MVVEVRLFASFREGRFKEKELELSEGSSMGDLLAQLDISQKEAKVMIVNGRGVSAEHKLADKDIVAIFPPIAGG
ncbi:MAG: MoaD/ThiS family protein [Planctomycetota bacterium]|jgi:sulfur carrier protein